MARMTNDRAGAVFAEVLGVDFTEVLTVTSAGSLFSGAGDEELVAAGEVAVVFTGVCVDA